MTLKEDYLRKLLERGYDNPKLSELSESALKSILNNEESFYTRNSNDKNEV